MLPKNFKKWSRAMARASAAALLLLPLWALAVWLAPSETLMMGGYWFHPFPSAVQLAASPQNFTPLARMGGFTAMMLPTTALMIALWHFNRLFGLFAEMEIFSQTSTQRFRHLAAAFFWYVFLTPVANTLTGLAVSFANPPGERILEITFLDSDLKTLFLAGLIYVLAMVFDEGRTLSEENAQIV